MRRILSKTQAIQDDLRQNKVLLLIVAVILLISALLTIIFVDVSTEKIYNYSVREDILVYCTSGFFLMFWNLFVNGIANAVVITALLFCKDISKYLFFAFCVIRGFFLGLSIDICFSLCGFTAIFYTLILFVPRNAAICLNAFTVWLNCAKARQISPSVTLTILLASIIFITLLSIVQTMLVTIIIRPLFGA